MFKKKLLALMSIFVLAAMILSACGGQQTPEATEEAPAEPAEELAVGIVLPRRMSRAGSRTRNASAMRWLLPATMLRFSSARVPRLRRRRTSRP